MYLRKPIIATLNIFTDWEIYMILPMMDGFLSSFMFVIFAKVNVFGQTF